MVTDRWLTTKTSLGQDSDDITAIRTLGEIAVGQSTIANWLGSLVTAIAIVSMIPAAKANNNIYVSPNTLGMFNNLINQAQRNQVQTQQLQLRQQAAAGWSQIDGRVVVCMQTNYRVTVQQLVDAGIGPADPRISGYVSQCTQAVSAAVARQQQQLEEQRQAEFTREQAREAAEAERRKAEAAAESERRKEQEIAAAQRAAQELDALDVLGFHPQPNKVTPSFDCAKAKVAIEQLLCSDSQLADADRAMGDAFRAHRSDPDVVQEQRDWLKERESSCGIPKVLSELSDSDRRDAISCLLEATDVRLQALGGAPPSAPDSALRDAITAYQKSLGIAQTGNLTPTQQTELIAKAASIRAKQQHEAEVAKAQQERDAQIVAEKEAWRKFLATNESAAKLSAAGDPEDLVGLLDTETPEYKSGQIVLTLNGQIDSKGRVSVDILGSAADVLRDKDGGDVGRKAMASHGVDPSNANIRYPNPTRTFVDGSDLYVVQRKALSDYPFLGVAGLRTSFMDALSGGHLIPILTIQNTDIASARTQRLAAEQKAQKQLAQQQAEAQKRADDLVQRSARIREGLSNGEITDYGLITVDGHNSQTVCALDSNDLDLLDAFDDAPPELKSAARKTEGDDDKLFVATRRGDCRALIAKGADLKTLMSGLYRDQVAFSVFPRTISLADAAKAIEAIAKRRQEAQEANTQSGQTSPTRPVQSVSTSLGANAPVSVMDGGTVVVPVVINDTITLDFIVDSGASDVSVPADVVSTLLRSGTLKPSDFIDRKTYVLADGSKLPSATFNITSLKVGDKLVQNVRAGVAPLNGPLLLGQSFLQRFKSWSIDNARHELVLQ